MRTFSARLSRTVTTAACTLAALSLGGQATAAPPESSLALSLRHSDGTIAVTQLHCDPAGGSHPASAQACEALDDAGGRPAALDSAGPGTACPMIYAPVHASAHGHWRGEPVHFTTTYNNACLADVESGGVFGF
ncbi:SSI family serine proteinase inhibitor [Prauserella alba]|uniref:Subtilisin inhibitor domain-containing protein n=1 Tax=Prauserella alba TaxID=176898 RepID=A0ABP4FYG4_9PSEU|nr:SSI family serine proteinase inhibitor [Prauserella alba]MCP2179659.1 Subtilisin inhibitor-like [Prauserella alba]